MVTCCECGAPAVRTINSFGYCMEHYLQYNDVDTPM